MSECVKCHRELGPAWEEVFVYWVDILGRKFFICNRCQGIRKLLLNQELNREEWEGGETNNTDQNGL